MRTMLSSYAAMAFRNAFLHFLHWNTISTIHASRCTSCSTWHAAQSNHFLQNGVRIEAVRSSDAGVQG